MSDAPTPETDAEFPKLYELAAEWVDADFARRLERELAEAKEQRDMLAEALRNLVRWFDPYDCPEAYTQATQALAAVKGEQP
jgi:hypothetical protein